MADTPATRALLPAGRAAIVRHLLLAIPVFLLVAGAVTALALVQEPLYTAHSQVFVKFGREFLYRPEVGSADRLHGLELEQIINTEVQILGSHGLAESTVEAIGARTLYPKLFEEAEDIAAAERKAVVAFREDLSVQAVLESSVIDIYYAHRDPELAARAVNHVVEAFLEAHLELFRKPQPHFIGESLETWQDRLDAAEQRVRAIEAEHHVVQLPEQIALLLRQESEFSVAIAAQEAALADVSHQKGLLGEIDPRPRNGDAVYLLETVEALAERRDAFSRELSGAELQITLLENELAAIRKQIDEGSHARLFATDEALDTAHARLLDLEVERQRLLGTFRPDSRRVRALEDEIAGVRRFIEKRTAEVGALTATAEEQRLVLELESREKVRQGLSAKITELEGKIHQRRLQDLVELEASVLARRTIAESQREQVREKIRALQGVTQELEGLAREASIADANVRTYLEKQEEANVTAELDKQKDISVRVLEEARPPVEPSGLSPKMMIALGIVAAGVAAVAAALALEVLRGAPVASA